jgi:LmbE family N-acetylglucosaminyl deacetylase
VTDLFLAPHNDDETLFGAFTIQRHQPIVVTALRSHYQADRWPAADYGHERREAETEAALAELGAPAWAQWEFDDRQPDWPAIRQRLQELPADGMVYAPFPEPVDGHDQHNLLGVAALDVFGRHRVQLYTTYSRQNGKSAIGSRVDPTPDEIAGKLRAMACYGSQLENWLTRPHFMRGLDEFLVTP